MVSGMVPPDTERCYGLPTSSCQTYVRTDGMDGRVSIEVDPGLAHETEPTAAEAGEPPVRWSWSTTGWVSRLAPRPPAAGARRAAVQGYDLLGCQAVRVALACVASAQPVGVGTRPPSTVASSRCPTASALPALARPARRGHRRERRERGTRSRAVRSLRWLPSTDPRPARRPPAVGGAPRRASRPQGAAKQVGRTRDPTAELVNLYAPTNRPCR